MESNTESNGQDVGASQQQRPTDEGAPSAAPERQEQVPQQNRTDAEKVRDLTLALEAERGFTDWLLKTIHQGHYTDSFNTTKIAESSPNGKIGELREAAADLFTARPRSQKK